MAQVLQIFLIFYVGTLVLNIIIAGVQFYGDRHEAQKAILLYWLGSLIAAAANVAFPENDLKLLVIAGFGLFVTTYFLGSFFTHLHELELPLKKLMFFAIGSFLLSTVLFGAGLNFTIYSFPTILATALPLLASLIIVLRKKKRPFTTMQKIFVVNATLMFFHWLDWSYTRTRPDLLLLGFAVATVLLHVLSILTPLMANEYSLLLRNEQLEVEIHNKVQQLTKTEKQLWETNKIASLGRLAGGVAHEINNPLQTIELHIENLQFHANQGSLSTEETNKISQSLKLLIRRIVKITDTLRKLARDNLTAQLEMCDLARIIKDTIALSQDRLDKLKIKLVLNVPDKPVWIQGIPIELSQLISNLINNSIEAVETLPDKQILVGVATSDDKIVLSVEDSGHIDRAHIPRLMDPFFTTKPLGKGMGLGLSIAKSIAESHQGNLFLDVAQSRTRFILELPDDKSTELLRKQV
jgi:signal transduction histidine kinase